MSVILGILVLLAIVAASALLLGFAIASMGRSRRRGTSGALSAAALEVQSLLEPSKKHVADSVREQDPETAPNSE